MSDGIFEKLEHLPKYHDEVERMKEDAQNTQLIFYLKPTTQWKLECESDHASSKETFHHLLETIGFTEENRHNDILSHNERKFWIWCLLSQILYLLIMTSFIFCGCAFEDIGKKYHEITVKMILASLLIFNCICYIVFVGQIVYT